MSMTIIVILVVAIAALLIVRSKQGQGSATSNKKAAASNKANNSTAKVKTTAKPASVKPVETKVSKPAIDLPNLLDKLDVLIADKEFAKAEGLINLSLNQDAELHELYFRLLKIYQLQSDDFAIKQLFETVQKLNLNEVYQKLFADHEAFKIEQELVQKANKSSKRPDIIEYTVDEDIKPVQQNETVAVEEEVDLKQNNTLEFDNLTFDTSSAAKDHLSPEPIADVAPVENNTLEFSITEPTPVETKAEPVFEFKLEEPTPTDVTNVEPLEFKLEEKNTPDTIADDLSFTESTSQQENTNISLASTDTEIQSTAPLAFEPVSTETTQFANLADPIVQAFPTLAQLDPADLDIDLAEQYIRLGEYQAAKTLLTEQQNALSTEQSLKLQQLLQKIA